MVEINKIICGDALIELRKIPDESIDTIITSPPYWKLRDYEIKGQIGLEESVQGYLIRLAEVFLQESVKIAEKRLSQGVLL